MPRGYRELNRSLSLLGDLRDIGWQVSARENAPFGGDGEALPWYSYPAIHWLDARLRPSDRIFEFGAGNSTLWYARRASSIVSVEHDIEWHKRITTYSPDNVTILLRQERDYVTAINEIDSDPYDVIVVDGALRNECAATASVRLANDGMIVYDNSDVSEYQEGLRELERIGFARIDFIGLTPGYGNISATSCLFRNGERWLRHVAPPAFLGYSPHVCG